jgi:hypothetical protein
MVRRHISQGGRVLFLAHRTELIKQSAATFIRGGIPRVRVINAGRSVGDRDADVTVASIPTLATDRWVNDLPDATLVIFDEAQRAWNREMTSDFMRRKKGHPGFTQSEPEFLLSYLDRHSDWAVVVCLVGGGQEINRGEAGISEWLDAVSGYIESGKKAGAHYADVDSEAYVVHILQLVISSAASAAVTVSVLDGDRDRYDRELARIARASLFTAQPPTKKRKG